MSFLGMNSKAEKTEAAILARLSGHEGITILLPFGGGMVDMIWFSMTMERPIFA